MRHDSKPPGWAPRAWLRLLANLVDGDGGDPVAVVDTRGPLHPVSAAAQDGNDLPLDVLLALAQHDDITGPGLRRRRRRWLRLGHDQPSRFALVPETGREVALS